MPAEAKPTPNPNPNITFSDPDSITKDLNFILRHETISSATPMSTEATPGIERIIDTLILLGLSYLIASGKIPYLGI